jgi:excisionase family DNA binding protein
VYTVADICNITGFKKSVIYSDIRSGRLLAFKKGNKYFIAKSDCDKYIEWKNHQQKILIGLAIGCVAIFILFVLFYLFMLFLLK